LHWSITNQGKSQRATSCNDFLYQLDLTLLLPRFMIFHFWSGWEGLGPRLCVCMCVCLLLL